MPRSLRSLIPDLPQRVWKILAADAVSALGTGLVMPFLVIYLRDVRHIDVQTAALAISSLAVVALAVGPLTGWVIDRLGPRGTLIVSLFVCSSGSALTALVREPWHAFAAAGVLGAGFSALWPATHSLLTSVVTPSQRSAAFSVHYATLNAGIGVGGILGGLVVDVDNARTFELLYVLDALSWLVFAAVLFRMRDVGRRVARAEDGGPSPGYRAVVSDRPFMVLMALMTLLVTFGYAQLEAGFPAYVTGEAGASTRVVGAAFAGNTLFIVLAQLVVLKLSDGRRRTRLLLALCALWIASYAAVIGGGRLEPSLLQSIAFVVALMLFGLGECLVSPSVPGMLNDLASDELRGRYNATYSLTFSIGHIVGPAMAGAFLVRERGETLFMVLIVGLAVCMFLIRRFEDMVPADANIASAADADEGAASTPREELVTA